jgi:DNA ligase-1
MAEAERLSRSGERNIETSPQKALDEGTDCRASDRSLGALLGLRITLNQKGASMHISVDPITLYKRDARGSLQFWKIWAQADTIWIEWGQIDGETQSQYERIAEGKAGRTLEEQIFSRINSRVEKKLDKGYVRSRIVALTTKAVNRLGLPRPMLAKPFKKVKKVNLNNSFLQFKYNGHRCLIHHNADGDCIAYSRNGKPITSIKEILSQISLLGLPRGYTLDGELYRHGTSLQRISSWKSRRQLSTSKLIYTVYDIVPTNQETFKKRLEILDGLRWSASDGITHIQKAPTTKCAESTNIQVALEDAVAQGYEGLILRQDIAPYEDGKRSNSLVKIKLWMVDEFLVVDIIPSREGYAVLRCTTKEGKIFGATAPGTTTEKFFVMKNKQHFIGRHIQLQFADWTDEKKPFHPVTIMWREKQSE